MPTAFGLCKTATLSHLALLAAATANALLTAGIASAEPDPNEEPISCPYALTTPRVVDLAGTPMVVTTLPPAQCYGRANSIHTMACLNIEGSNTAPQCVTATGQNTAYAYYSYRPGATYVATGNGCATGIEPVSSYCNSVGPLTTTL